MAVRFEEDQLTVKVSSNTGRRGILGFIIRIGLARNKNQAQYILLIITVIAVFITIYLLTNIGEPPVPLAAPSAT